MKMLSAFIELLHEDGRTEINKEPNAKYLAFFPKHTQTVTQLMCIAADCCSHRDTVPLIFSCTTAQHIYCTNTVQSVHLQLNCTYSNYTDAAATCSAAQRHSTFTV